MHVLSAAMRAAGHGAGELARGCTCPYSEVSGTSQNPALLSFHISEKGAVSASPSLRDYWELKIPIGIEEGVRKIVPTWDITHCSTLRCGSPGWHLNLSPTRVGGFKTISFPLGYFYAIGTLSPHPHPPHPQNKGFF